MIQSARTQAQLIEDLLDISRIVSGKLRFETQAVDLIDVIHSALDTVRPAVEAKNLQVRLELNRAASSITGDANRLQQVVWNLLSNATKFTPPGGNITVRLEKVADQAQLSISDTGQGISPAFLPFVFDRFRQADGSSTRSHNGLGLGLAIVRHLVELHGGTVQASSAGEEQGATFSVSFPLTYIPHLAGLVITTNSEDKAGLPDCPPELRGLRVVVVDDQPAIVELISEVLVSCGVNVRACQTAREALEQVRQWQPDVLISDVAMPGEDGYWLIRNIRGLTLEEGGATPAIALTAYVRIEDRLRVLAAGFEQYLPKPVEPAELRDVVVRLVRT